MNKYDKLLREIVKVCKIKGLTSRDLTGPIEPGIPLSILKNVTELAHRDPKRVPIRGRLCHWDQASNTYCLHGLAHLAWHGRKTDKPPCPQDYAEMSPAFRDVLLRLLSSGVTDTYTMLVLINNYNNLREMLRDPS